MKALPGLETRNQLMATWAFAIAMESAMNWDRKGAAYYFNEALVAIPHQPLVSYHFGLMRKRESRYEEALNLIMDSVKGLSGELELSAQRSLNDVQRLLKQQRAGTLPPEDTGQP